MNLVITGTLVVIGYLLSRHLMGLFLTDAKVLDLAQSLLHIMLWSSVVFGCASVVSGVMRASGTVLIPTAISIFCIVLIEVPSAYLLSHRIGLEGVWWAYPIAFCSMLVLQSAFYRLVWRQSKIERLV
jgi:Na+-driven multidrug efflux pump